MKFRVTMKDTDVLQDGIEDAVDEDLKNSNLPEDEQEAVRELRIEKCADVANEWFTYGEYLEVEIDTDTRSIRVVPRSESES